MIVCIISYTLLDLNIVCGMPCYLNTTPTDGVSKGPGPVLRVRDWVSTDPFPHLAFGVVETPEPSITVRIDGYLTTSPNWVGWQRIFQQVHL